jgi:hypothetical protein
LTSGSLSHDDHTIVVADALDGPCATAKKERRHVLDEAVHEALLERAEVAPAPS